MPETVYEARRPVSVAGPDTPNVINKHIAKQAPSGNGILSQSEPNYPRLDAVQGAGDMKLISVAKLGIGMSFGVIALAAYSAIEATEIRRAPIKDSIIDRSVNTRLLPSYSGIFELLGSWTLAAESGVGGKQTPVQQDTQNARPGLEFKDCPNGCPVLIVVPAGKFIMGSPEGEPDRNVTEGPLHEVTIAKFAVSKFEVTFDNWDACVSAAACPQVPDGWGRGTLPVINVSWRDAKQYLGWLSQLTGKEYRLLTEAEWEYAARAGTNTPYSWGENPAAGDANCDGCGSRWDLQQTAPVGSFGPNVFGLHDMHGNVWEWVEDSWHDKYDRAPGDGSAWFQGGDPDYRVIRGGSWRNERELVRAAVRFKRNINVRFDTLGFRVARSMEP
jgi:formylglycine-generating enzyme required for sulfatase activity